VVSASSHPLGAEPEPQDHDEKKTAKASHAAQKAKDEAVHGASLACRIAPLQESMMSPKPLIPIGGSSSVVEPARATVALAKRLLVRDGTTAGANVVWVPNAFFLANGVALRGRSVRSAFYRHDEACVRLVRTEDSTAVACKKASFGLAGAVAGGSHGELSAFRQNDIAETLA
jgi:hypothetical protein